MLAKERTAWLDLARIMATLAVILCHALEAVYALNVPFMNSLSIKTRVFGFSAFTVGRLGVPFFLMISGYLLLDREYNSEKTIGFWKGNCLHLFICTEIWLIIYAAFARIINAGTYTFSELLEMLLFLRNVSAAHLWYMPMILGIYLLIPFISNGIRHINPRLLLFPILVFSAYTFGLTTWNTAEYFLAGKVKGITFFTQFSGGAYGILFLMGYAIKKGCLKRIKTIYIALFCGIMFAATVAFQYIAYSFEYGYNVWYDNLLLFLCSTALFELISRINLKKNKKAITVLSYYSFPVYLVHFGVKTALMPFLNVLNIHYPFKVILLFCGTSVLSLFLGVLISKVPKVGKYILYLK